MNSDELKKMLTTTKDFDLDKLAVQAMIPLIEQMEQVNKNLDRIGDKLNNLTDAAKTMARKS
jgi:hypothetical protein